MEGAGEAKRARRAPLRARRRERAGEPGRELAAQRIADAVVGLVEQRLTQTGCRVAAYRSTSLEPPTGVLVRRLRDAGHEVLLPVTGADRTLAWDLAGQLLPPEALATADLVLTPGLAVDRRGVRLGQGGGYYDVALTVVPSGVPVVTVLWDDELVDGPLPAEQHDRRVDAVLTPGRGVVWLTPYGSR